MLSKFPIIVYITAVKFPIKAYITVKRQKVLTPKFIWWQNLYQWNKKDETKVFIWFISFLFFFSIWGHLILIIGFPYRKKLELIHFTFWKQIGRKNFFPDAKYHSDLDNIKLITYGQIWLKLFPLYIKYF